MNTTIKGKTFAYFETGTEGILWSVQNEDHPDSYEGLCVLKKGDHLTIKDNNDKVVFDGVIDLEYETHQEVHPFSNPPLKQQAVKGCWIHGLQRNVDAEDWFDWFQNAYDAVLVPKEPPLFLKK